MKLVKYSDNELRGEYIWFYIDDQMGTQISPTFNTEEEANEWLDEILNRLKGRKDE